MAPASLIGEMVQVTITHTHANSLFGTLADAPGLDAESPDASRLVAAGA
jgi:hypothetical protein